MAKDEFGTTLETAVSEVATELSDAIDFISSEFADEWSRAEKYFAGKVDAKDVVGRSTVVKSEVRDSIRALKPSVLRVLLHARKIVEYIPASVEVAPFVEQQALFVTQLFWKSDGYKVIYSATDEAMKKKIGPIKSYWEENPTPEYYSYTALTSEDVDAIKAAPDHDIDELSVHKTPSGVTDLPEVVLYDISGYKYYPNGRIRLEAFPAHEYVTSRNSTCREDAFIHGHRRTATVAEAIELGLEYDEWHKLDNDDPENNEHAEEALNRRGYNKDDDGDVNSDDMLNHRFTLSEIYVKYDLRGTGTLQRYCFWLGGSNNTYLHHEEVSDWCIDVVEIDPVPFTQYGRSISDLTVKEQDTQTSLLRAIVDNAHMANNPRYAANPMLTDFADLMNNGIGAPIKNKAGGEIQVIDIPFTGQQLLPFMQYLEADTENKVGITKAAQGLDPDAMQSTDKNAVRNTIALAQGQTELIVRNIIETGLIPLFKRLLRLSIAHMDASQVVRTKGLVLPITTALFDPDLVAEPTIGLGTASPEQKMQALSFVLNKQESILAQFGLDNPFTSLSQIYNTLEDMVELSGLYDVGRYFKIVTTDIEQQLAKQQAEAKAAAEAKGESSEPMDPTKALLQIEQGKEAGRDKDRKLKVMGDKRTAHLQVIKDGVDEDLARDKLVQDKILKLADMQEKGRAARAADRIKREQADNNKPTPEVQQ